MPIYHSRPWLTYHEINAVIDVLRSKHLSTGLQCERLECELSQMFHRECLLVSSGTAALHFALLAGNIKKDDPVAVPTHACPSVLYALNYIEAEPVLYDCGELGYGLNETSFLQAVSISKAVIIVHSYGAPVFFKSLIENKKLWVIEDCAQSFGAQIKGKYVGTQGDIAIFSFYPTKLIAGGELGALIGSQSAISKLRKLRSPHFADDDMIRYPYTPSDVFAAVARIQIKKLDIMLSYRKTIAEWYIGALKKKSSIQLPAYNENNVWYRFIIGMPSNREIVQQVARKAGIHLGYGVKTPLHKMLGKSPSGFPNSEQACRYSVSLPIYPGLSAQDVERVVGVISGIMQNYPPNRSTIS